MGDALSLDKKSRSDSRNVDATSTVVCGGGGLVDGGEGAFPYRHGIDMNVSGGVGLCQLFGQVVHRQEMGAVKVERRDSRKTASLHT